MLSAYLGGKLGNWNALWDAVTGLPVGISTSRCEAVRRILFSSPLPFPQFYHIFVGRNDALGEAKLVVPVPGRSLEHCAAIDRVMNLMEAPSSTQLPSRK